MSEDAVEFYSLRQVRRGRQTGRVRAVWFAGRRRVVLVNGRFLRVKTIPMTLIERVTHEASLWVYAHERPTVDAPFQRVLGPNIISSSVCLGTAYERVRSGELDSFQAFWMSDFDYASDSMEDSFFEIDLRARSIDPLPHLSSFM